MATLSQLAAQKQGAIPVSTAMQGESKLAAPTYQVGEKLANDVMGMIGAKNKAVTAINDASVEGAKRVALDKNKEMALYIEDVKAKINPNDPNSLADAQKALSVKYAELSNTGFAFPAAMEAFDQGFTSPAAINIARMNTVLEQDKIELMDKQGWIQNEKDDELVRESGNIPTAEQNKTRIKSMTAYQGVESEDKATYILAQNSSTSFKNKTMNDLSLLLKSGGYDPEKGFDKATAMSIFNSNFSDFGTMDKDGKISFHSYVNSETEDLLRNTWNTFDRMMNADDGVPHNDKYYQTIDSATKVNANANSQTVPSSVQAENIKTMETGFAEADKNIPLTDSQRNGARKSIATAKRGEYFTYNVEQDIKLAFDNLKSGEAAISINSVNDLKKYMIKGKKVTYVDFNSKEKVTEVIPAKKYKEVYNSMLTTDSNKLLDIGMDKKGSLVFLDGLEKLNRLEAAGGGTSMISQTYNPIMVIGEEIPVLDVNSIWQFIEHEKFKGTSDSNRRKNQPFLLNLEKKLSALDKKDPDYVKKFTNMYTNNVKDEKSTKRNAAQAARVLPTVTAINSDMIETGDLFSHGTFFDAQKAYGLDLAVSQKFSQDGKTDNIQYNISKMTTFDYGSDVVEAIGGRPQFRGYNPSGLKESDTRKAIDEARIAYNTRTTSTLNAADVDISQGYDPVTQELTVIVKPVGDSGTTIATITSRDGKLLSEKYDLRPWYFRTLGFDAE